MRIRAFIAKIQYGAANAAQKRYTPVNENCDRGISEELHNACHDNRRKLISVAGTGGIIADGIGEAPAALICIKTPAGIKNRP